MSPDDPREDKGRAVLTCKHCHGTAFSFEWSWASQGELLALSLAHPGIGLQFEDALIRCVGCGADVSKDGLTTRQL